MGRPLLRAFQMASLLFLWMLGVSAPVLAGWNLLDSGTVNALNAVYFVDLDHGYAVGASGTGLKTTDAGATWQAMSTGTTTDLNDVAFVGDVGIIVGNGGTILRTTDAGVNWSSVPSGVLDDLLSVSLSVNAGICGARSQTILYTTDAGASWAISQSGFFGGGFWGAVMLSPDIAFVGGENSIFQPLSGKSTDGGATWSFSAFYLNSNEGRIAGIEFTDETTGYAASRVWDGRGAISKTTNGGLDWTTTLFSSALSGVTFPVSDASQVGYTVGSLGRILKTTNAGVSWQEQDSGIVTALQDVHFLDFDHGFAVGDGGTILKTTDGGETVSSTGDVPSTAGLDRSGVLVTPNPFLDTTQFRYRITEPGWTNLTIFDARGRRVRTLVDGRQVTGSYVVDWEGTDNLDRPLPSGAFKYRLESGTRVETGNVLILR